MTDEQIEATQMVLDRAMRGPATEMELAAFDMVNGMLLFACFHKTAEAVAAHSANPEDCDWCHP